MAFPDSRPHPVVLGLGIAGALAYAYLGVLTGYAIGATAAQLGGA